MFKNKDELIKPCIIGLGYVGLPILVNLSKKYKTSGYDINKKRIFELKRGIDVFGEFKKNNFGNKVNFQNKLNKVSSSNLFIVTVPTPIFKNKKPDLSYIKKACLDISRIVKKGDIIIS